ncbi:MAG: peptidoglycan-binding protein [Myxococcota bacterium]
MDRSRKYGAALRGAIRYNRRHHHEQRTRRVQATVGAEVDGIFGPETVVAVMEWQAERGLEPDGKVGPLTLAALREQWTVDEDGARLLPLDEAAEDAIIRATVAHETAGALDPYAAVNQDAEYEGWFDRPRRDASGRLLRPAERAEREDHKPFWASKFREGGGTHVGLSYGIIQFTQDGGALGEVLAWVAREDRARFEELFGEHSGELLRVLSGPKGARRPREGMGPGKRSRRVVRVADADLWKMPWVGIFQEAAKDELMRHAQRRVASQSYLHPAARMCKEFGLSTQADIAVAFDTSVQYGRRGARRRFEAAHDQHGDAMTIWDVLQEFADPVRSRHRRVFEAADPAARYDLSRW